MSGATGSGVGLYRRADGRTLSVPAMSVEADDGGGDGIVFGLSGLQIGIALAVALVALLVVVGAVAAAGAFFLFASGDDTDLQLVPAGADTVTYVNVDQATSDEAIRQVVDSYLQLRAESDFYGGPTTTEEALSRFQRETGLDPDALHHATSFSRYDERTGTGADEYSATIIRSDWSEADLVRAIERDSGVRLTETEYNGATVYAPRGAAGTSGWIAVLGDGKYAIGTERAVRDVVDVREGDREALSGELKSTFEDTRSGYVRFAARIPQQRIPDQEMQGVDAGEFRSVEMVSGAYYTSGNTLGVEFTMHAVSDAEARDVRDVTEGSISLATGFAENETVESTLRDVEVSQSGSAVTVTYENSADDVATVLRALEESEGGAATAALVAPTAGDEPRPAVEATAGDEPRPAVEATAADGWRPSVAGARVGA